MYRIFSLLILIVIGSQNGFADNNGSLRNVDIIKDISFGNHQQQKIDIYRPHIDDQTNLPIIIYVHGGAWRVGDKAASKKLGQFYAERGSIFISVNYRLSHTAKHPAQVEDLAAAVKWVADNIALYGGRPNDIILTGHSAGAHLVALVATDPIYLSKQGLSPHIFKLVVPVDTAAFNLNVAAQSNPKLVKRLIHKNFGKDKKSLSKASPTFQTLRHHVTPPPFMTFTSNEHPAAVKETRIFTKALRTRAGQAQNQILDGINHKQMNVLIAKPDSPIAMALLTALFQ